MFGALLLRRLPAATARVAARCAASSSIRMFSEATPDLTPPSAQTEDRSNEIPSGWKGIRRFYDDVAIRPVNAEGVEVQPEEAVGYRIVIRGRELRTNGMNELTVRWPRRGRGTAWAPWPPSACPPRFCVSLSCMQHGVPRQVPTRVLALAIAGEFASQGEMIHPPSLPLVRLAALSPRIALCLPFIFTCGGLPPPHSTICPAWHWTCLTRTRWSPSPTSCTR